MREWWFWLTARDMIAVICTIIMLPILLALLPVLWPLYVIWFLFLLRVPFWLIVLGGLFFLTQLGDYY